MNLIKSSRTVVIHRADSIVVADHCIVDRRAAEIKVGRLLFCGSNKAIAYICFAFFSKSKTVTAQYRHDSFCIASIDNCLYCGSESNSVWNLFTFVRTDLEKACVVLLMVVDELQQRVTNSIHLYSSFGSQYIT